MNTINYIKDTNINHNEKINKIKNNNIDKCIKWCKQYNQPLYKALANSFTEFFSTCCIIYSTFKY